MGGSLTLKELLDCNRNCRWKFNNFVETGTYHANTTILASHLYDKVISIELNRELYLYSQSRIRDSTLYNNITLYNNDSLSVLGDIVKSLNGNTIYFLDAHQSGYDTSNNGNNVPLIEEIDLILANSNDGDMLFILDDVRFWGIDKEWKNITKDTILQRFSKHNVIESFEQNDRFYVFVKK